MDFIDEDMKLAVKKGAYWFDENHPGWAKNINTAKLDMANCERCVIGQAVMHMSYWAVIDEAEGSMYTQNAMNWAIEHGFDADQGNISIEDWYSEDGCDLSPLAKSMYSGLETLWTDEVKKRLG